MRKQSVRMRTGLFRRLVDDHDALVGRLVTNALHDRSDDRQTHRYRRDGCHGDADSGRRGATDRLGRGARGDASGQDLVPVLTSDAIRRRVRRRLQQLTCILAVSK